MRKGLHSLGDTQYPRHRLAPNLPESRGHMGEKRTASPDLGVLSIWIKDFTVGDEGILWFPLKEIKQSQHSMPQRLQSPREKEDSMSFQNTHDGLRIRIALNFNSSPESENNCSNYFKILPFSLPSSFSFSSLSLRDRVLL